MSAEPNWAAELQAGNPQALRFVYAIYKDDLLSLAAFLLKDLPSAEDVLQDVFLHLIEHPPGVRDQNRLKSYLAACVANRARDLLRYRSRTESRGDQPLQPGAEPVSPFTWASPVAGLVEREDAQLVRRRRLALPQEQREVIVMHLFGSLTFKEISRCLSSPQNTVQSRYRYGMEKLRSSLQEEYVT